MKFPQKVYIGENMWLLLPFAQKTEKFLQLLGLWICWLPLISPPFFRNTLPYWKKSRMQRSKIHKIMTQNFRGLMKRSCYWRICPRLFSRDIIYTFLQLRFRFQTLKWFSGIYSGFSYNFTFFSRVPFFAWGCLNTVSLDFSISLA